MIFETSKRLIRSTARLQASTRTYQEWCRREEEKNRNVERLRAWRAKYAVYARYFPGNAEQ